MVCEVCENRAELGAVVNSRYAHYCKKCYHNILSKHTPSSGEADFDRQRDLEDHLADVAQPYVGGLPNADFIHLYPDKAKQMFTPDELRKYQ